MFENDNFFIQVLKSGANDLAMGSEGLTYDDIKSEMQSSGYRIDIFEEHQKIWQVIREAFIYPDGIGEKRKYYLSLDSFFNFLDYIELNDSKNPQNRHLNY